MIKIVLDRKYELDGLDPDSSFVVTLQESSFKTITERGASFSNLVQFAKTARNVSFFGPLDVVNFTGAGPYRLYDADVYDDDLLVFSGVFKLMESNHDFKGRVFGASAGLFDILKGVDIQQLDLSALNHTYDAATVNGKRQATTGVVYPNINYGLWTAETLPGSGTAFTDFYPAVYIDDILEAAATQAGYAYTKLGSDFIIPFCNKDFYANQTLTNNECQSTTDQTITVDNVNITERYTEFDNEILNPLQVFSQDSGTKDYTSLNLGQGGATCEITFTYTANAGNTGSVIIEARDILNGRTLSQLVAAPGATGTETFIFDFENTGAGSSSSVVLRIDSGNVNDSAIISSGAKFILLTGTQEILSGSTVPVADILPPLDCVELFKYMATRLNALMIADNKAKTFHFLEFNDIADNFGNAVDWSGRVQNDDEVRLLYHLDEYGQENYLQYEVQPESDPSRNVSQIGRGTITIDDTTLDGSKVLYAAPFTRSAIFEGFSNVGAMIFIPRYSDPSIDYREPDIDPKFRVLQSVIDASIDVKITGETAPATQCNPVFTGFASDVVNYYGSFSTALNRAKVIEVFLQLNNLDIEFFEVSKPVFLLNAYWFVLKIEQFEIGNYSPTKVKLLRLY